MSRRDVMSPCHCPYGPSANGGAQHRPRSPGARRAAPARGVERPPLATDACHRPSMHRDPMRWRGVPHPWSRADRCRLWTPLQGARISASSASSRPGRIRSGRPAQAPPAAQTRCHPRRRRRPARRAGAGTGPPGGGHGGPPGGVAYPDPAAQRHRRAGLDDVERRARPSRRRVRSTIPWTPRHCRTVAVELSREEAMGLQAPAIGAVCSRPGGSKS